MAVVYFFNVGNSLRTTLRETWMGKEHRLSVLNTLVLKAGPKCAIYTINQDDKHLHLSFILECYISCRSLFILIFFFCKHVYPVEKQILLKSHPHGLLMTLRGWGGRGGIPLL